MHAVIDIHRILSFSCCSDIVSEARNECIIIDIDAIDVSVAKVVEGDHVRCVGVILWEMENSISNVFSICVKDSRVVE